MEPPIPGGPVPYVALHPPGSAMMRPEGFSLGDQGDDPGGLARLAEENARLRALLDARSGGAAEAATEIERAHEALRVSEARFRALIEKATDMIVVLDAEGVIRHWSPSATETLGWTAEEVIGRPSAEFLHPDDMAALGPSFEAMARTPGATNRVVMRHRHKDGSWRFIEAFGRNLLDDPAVRGIVANTRDVTDQRRLEEAVQQSMKLESIGRLAGGIAHDFNNLLTVILSCAEELASDVAQGAPVRAEDVEEIRAAGTRARDLTRQLLMFARRQVASPAVLDPNELVSGTEKLLRRIVGEDVDLAVSLAPGAWPVRCDPSHLEQVLMNLAANARDAMPRGGRLEISTDNVSVEAGAGANARPPPGDFVRLTLTDTGTGMIPAVKAHLFEPFFTTKPAGQGTGLGLSTVYGLVRQMDGHLLVESEPGRGTTFVIHLPRTAAAAAPPAGQPRRAGSRGTESILVVEDDPAVRDTVARALRSGGYRLLVAAGGEEALAILGREPRTPDLLVTDVVMPGTSVGTFVEEARKRHPSLRVLYVSGYAQDAALQRGVREGEMLFLQKPFTPSVLLARVRAVLDAE